MAHGSLLMEFEDLTRSLDAQGRARALEVLVEDLFRQNHFTVTRNAGSAQPRQTDVFAWRDRDEYLVEVKWRKSPAGTPDIVELRDRLSRAPHSVVGILVSVGGFAVPAIEEVTRHRDRPILLIDGVELRSLFDGSVALHGLLHAKLRKLSVHGTVHVGARAADRRPRHYSPPPSRSSVILGDGARQQLLRCAGGYEDVVFVDEVPDVDWTAQRGFGVALDIEPEVFDEAGVINVLIQLSSLGWTSPAARWCIRQSHDNWHGFGADSFVEALKGWRDRYATIERAHHTEEFSYYDLAERGFYTLAGDLSADESRRSSVSNISFQLSGIPLDTAPLLHLTKEVASRYPAEFRPLAERAVEAGRLWGEQRIALTAAGYVIEQDRLGRLEEEWVAGVIVLNPFRRTSELEDPPEAPERWPLGTHESEYLVCTLRHHHTLNESPKSYYLHGWDSTWTSDVLLLSAIADWDDPEPIPIEGDRPPRKVVRA